MKDKQYKKLVKNLKSPNQIETFQWLVHHHIEPFSALYTWNILFNERSTNNPDVCIKLYDELNMEEKIGLEYAFSTFVYSASQKTLKKG